MIEKHYAQLIVAVILLIGFIPNTAFAEDAPNIQSETAILMDGKTGQVLYGKNSKDAMYPASITKIVTALMAVNSNKMDEMVTVSANAREVEGTRVYLKKGEKVPLEKLVKGMLINSGNDAAIAIAEHLSGSVESFSSEMNDFLRKEVGVQNTHFVNPNGLFDENHFTTAEDMAKITQYAMKNEAFRSLFGIKQMEWSGEDWETTLINHHRLILDYDFVTGGKNGYVSESGFTLVTTASKGDQDLIAVTMKAADDRIAYQDTLNLLNYGFTAFSPVHFEEGTELGVVDQQEYSLSDNITLYQTEDHPIDLKLSSENNLESVGNSYVSTLDSDHLTTTSVERKDSEVTNEVAPIAEVKDEETESILSSRTILYLGIGIFLFIIICLIFGRSNTSVKRHRTFP
ncbi:D-alanyl-D-alanine carboxypeptidase family protein [Bacillus sp. RAR_GA_16]|uniref:D-alanyl-D-alanine carboxypeptidase family protein n=1 Tax=Bacillus sp. RAR_GA_16 TaxID=2876774 RepID=UPI001CC93DA6|nr:D-alanyl-D-alanine carboxypeptidase family protein [Bacillus sp. RAR_GA_16]MCA0172032.1 D-alanyl-D-alanine carboxypeptidase [Bacillus sp. RAR_GA_16]